MDQDIQKAFELAAAVYRVAKLLPEGEVLVIKIKELALDILADFIKNDCGNTKNKIKVLENFFKLARLQGWVSSTNFDILEKKYQEHSEVLDRPKFSPAKTRKVADSILTTPTIKEAPERKRAILTQRQEQILRFLATQKEFRLKEIRKSFSKISDKTLRNDLKALVNLKYLRREGQGAGSVYAVIR